MEKTRIDKWLWTVRIFKSRSMATQACKSGKVKVNNAKCKPARPIAGGEHISVDKNGLKLQFKILEILKSRVAYAIAKDCYEDLTPAEEREKFRAFYHRRHAGEDRVAGAAHHAQARVEGPGALRDETRAARQGGRQPQHGPARPFKTA